MLVWVCINYCIFSVSGTSEHAVCSWDSGYPLLHTAVLCAKGDSVKGVESIGSVCVCAHLLYVNLLVKYAILFHSLPTLFPPTLLPTFPFTTHTHTHTHTHTQTHTRTVIPYHICTIISSPCIPSPITLTLSPLHSLTQPHAMVNHWCQ